MKYKIQTFKIRNFRSILKLDLKPKENNFLTICGINNVGKTNFLRALNLFFNPIDKNFNANDDIPCHIVEGSRGGGFKTTLSAQILEIDTKEIYTIKQVFTETKSGKSIIITGKKGTKELNANEIIKFLETKFKFFFIEASNVNIPKLISEIINDEILPLSLDKRRSKSQMESLN